MLSAYVNNGVQTLRLELFKLIIYTFEVKVDWLLGRLDRYYRVRLLSGRTV